MVEVWDPEGRRRRGALERSFDEYESWMSAKIREVVVEISRHERAPVTFLCSMGIYFFQVGDNTEYKGHGAQEMLDLLDDTLDDYGWRVIPAVLIKAHRGKIIS